MKPERVMQPPFSFVEHLQALGVGALIILAAKGLPFLPDRKQLPPGVSIVRFEQIELRENEKPPLRLIGAWQMTSDDPRFGGFSGLVFDRDQLLALTDSGAIARFAKPMGPGSRPASIMDLPDGPGKPSYRINRDTEALVADPQGFGWWVSFEQWNQVWLYDQEFIRPVRRLRFHKKRWPNNAGIEGMAAAGSDLLLIAEAEAGIIHVRGPRPVSVPLDGKQRSLSEALRLPDGRLALVERGLTFTGFKNALLLIEEKQGAYRVGKRIPLPVGGLDIMEGMAAERLAGGTIRLWMISDDNFQRPMRTLLIALDLPNGSDRP